jgi:hypothetical protein
VGYVSVSYKTVSHQMCLSSPTTNGAFRQNLVREICQEHLKETEKGILDSSPDRELAEEFEDTLNVRITPDQYHLKPRGIILEDLPSETENVRAQGLPTVRIYYLFEARMDSHDMITMMLANNRRYSDNDLQEMAWKDARQGGSGRENAILALGLDDLKDVYLSIPTDKRGGPIRVGCFGLKSP